MSQRDAKMMWLRDILEHLTTHQQRLEWAEDQETIHILTQTMIRDLERCQRLCQELSRGATQTRH